MVNTTDIIKEVSSSTPSTVISGIDLAQMTLSLGDLIRLEEAGIKFINLGGNPTTYETSILYFYLTDKPTFIYQMNKGMLKDWLLEQADATSLPAIMQAMSGIGDMVRRSFAPVASESEDGEGKQMEPSSATGSDGGLV